VTTPRAIRLDRVKPQLFLAARLLPLALAATGCDRVASFTSRAGADTVYVGVAVGLRTPERYVDVFTGVQMALDRLNAGRPDDAPVLALKRAPDSARTVVDVALAFRDDPTVVGVVGHTETDATIDAAPIYDDRTNGGKRALVAVTPIAGGSQVTRVSEWVFRTCPVLAMTAEVLARFARDSLHATRAAVIYRNDPMGKEFRDAFHAEFRRGGGVVEEADPFTEDIAEFSAYGARIARRGIPLIAMAGNTPDIHLALRTARAAGANPYMLSLNAPPPIDQVSGRHEYVGWHYLANFSADAPPTDEGARFVDEFRKTHGRLPDHWSALSFDAAMLIGRAVQDVGPDRKRIRDWIAEVGRSRPAHIGVSGRIAFDEEGDPVDKPVLVRTEGAR